MSEQLAGADLALFFNANDDSVSVKASTREPGNGIRLLLRILLQAQDYAQNSKRDVWDFALELPNLCAIGLSINDLRWSAYMGYIDHAEEIDAGERSRRTFQAHPQLTFTQRSSFVLTDKGAHLARQVLNAEEIVGDVLPTLGESIQSDKSVKSVTPRAGGNNSRSSMAAYGLLPNWDGERRELRIGGVLIKSFRLPSPNQEALLSAFEEDGWPTRIDDPLPPVESLNPKRRLHDTIKSLNRNQKSRAVRFMGDGRGEGVLWELIPTAAPIALQKAFVD